MKNGEGLGDELRNILRRVNQGAERGERRCHGALIRDLVQTSPALAKRFAAVRAGNEQHGNGVRVGLGQGGGTVGHARAGNQRANARLSGHSPVTVGHEAGTLFVPGQHMANCAALDPPVELQGMLSRDAENHLHAVVPEQVHQGLAAGHPP